MPTLAVEEYRAVCLDAGPLSQAAHAAVDAAAALGRSRSASTLRAWSVVSMFGAMERAFASGRPPTPQIAAALRSLATFFESAEAIGSMPGAGDEGDAASNSEPASVVATTASHYGRLFERFAPQSFWEEPRHLLQVRLERNSVPSQAWTGRRVLDAGCGGGRYTVAWRLLGASGAVGIDMSEPGIGDARARVAAANIDGVSFEVGDVLGLPCDDASFDVVFSNGVLHHTVDWRRGVAELLRTLKPGGLGWLYLIENPGGLFWDVIEILRVVMQGEDRERARQALTQLGVPANRTFYMLDHVMVPINVRLTPWQVEQALDGAGAVKIRRLARGADFDRVEALYRHVPYAEEQYGVGENRYVFSKA